MKSLTRLGIHFILASFIGVLSQLAAVAIEVQQTNIGGDAIIQPTDTIRFQFDRLPTPEEGRLAIFIGRTDITSQFQIVGTELVYQPTLFLLPVGENQITVYLVKGNEWQEVTQIPLKVSTPLQPDNSTATSTEQPQPERSTPETNSQPTIEPEIPETEKPTVEQSEQPQAEPSDATIEPSNPESLEVPSQPSSEATQPETEVTPTEVIPVEPGTAAGLSFSFKPRLNATIKSQFQERRSRDAGESERPTFNDATVETGFESTLQIGKFSLQSRASFLGVTFQPEALRFGELQEAAPQFDLSEYQIDATWGALQFSMGHLCYGNHPFLLDNFCSRGMTLKAQINDRIDLSINSMNATSVVGFSNLSGLNDFNNNITSATLGYQLIKNNASGVRFEATFMSGERKAVNNFNQGEVVDTEKSRGFGFRLFGSDSSGRLRFDTGFARSRFTNPPDRQLSGAEVLEDPFLNDIPEENPIEDEIGDGEIPNDDIDENSGDGSTGDIINDIINNETESEIDGESEGTEVVDEVSNDDLPNDVAEDGGDEEVPPDESIDEPVDEIPEENDIEEDIEDPFDREVVAGEELEVIPVEPVTRNAFYAEISYDLLREVSLGGNRTLSLTLNARHERIDPQFQTLGASVTADQLRNRIGLDATIAGATLQFQQEWLEDNLANIPTILKTKTRNTSLNLNVPLQTVLGSSSQWLPTLNYSYQRVHQFGANFPIPELSGFDETEIPDQLNIQHQLGAQWNFNTVSLSYQFSSSLQDNRQPSRENADFRNITNQISLSWQASPSFQLSVGYNWSSARSIEEGITQFNQSPTIGISWQFLKNVTLAMSFSRNDNFDSFDRSFARGDSLEAILTWNFNVRAGAGLEIPGSAFIRYSRISNINRDNLFGLSSNSTIEIINAGLSFSF
jgi:hypothetical protein